MATLFYLTLTVQNCIFNPMILLYPASRAICLAIALNKEGPQ